MYRRGYMTVRDLNSRLRGQLARCPKVDRDNTRFRLFYVNLFQGCRYMHEQLNLLRVRAGGETFKLLAKEAVFLERTALRWGSRKKK